MFLSVLVRASARPLCPSPEAEAGLPVLVHIPFKDVRCLVQTGQFLGRGLPVDSAAKTDRRTASGEPSQPRASEQGRVAVPRHEHALTGVLAIELPVWSEHRPIGRDQGRGDAHDGATDLQEVSNFGRDPSAGSTRWPVILPRNSSTFSPNIVSASLHKVLAAAFFPNALHN